MASDGFGREMPLSEWVDRLPKTHQARQEFADLERERDHLKAMLDAIQNGLAHRGVVDPLGFRAQSVFDAFAVAQADSERLDTLASGNWTWNIANGMAWIHGERPIVRRELRAAIDAAKGIR